MKREASAMTTAGPHRPQIASAETGLKPLAFGLYWLGLPIAALLLCSGAQADPKRAAPLRLSDTEMDGVTAGGLGLRLDLASAATGPAAFASVAGETRIGRATMLEVALDPAAPPQAQARLTGTQAVEIGLGSGRAVAIGDAAHCSASAAALGDISYLHSLSSAVAAPGAATCLCSLFAIAPIK